MQPDAREAAHLRDMLDYARRVARLVAGVSPNQYLADEPRRMAVERGLEVVGEAARRTSADTRARYAHIAWRAIIGQRNVLAHEYGSIQQEMVWTAAVRHTPALIQQLVEIVPDPPDSTALPWNHE